MALGGTIQGSLTAFHAKYLAHELTRRCPSDSVEKLASVLADAQVDLNPHQVEAALFAFRSPFSKGAILADEVGLGKTIEAGLLLAQKWAENRRRLLVIVPANLRKQWSQELEDKFHLPSTILETRTFNEAIEASDSRAMSVATLVEVSIVIESRYGAEGLRDLDLFVGRAGIELVPVDLEQAHEARRAFSRYGRGRHAAGLDFGDCFAYALARSRGEPLLFKGADFSHTDIVPSWRQPGS